MLEFAIETALDAGRILLEKFGKIDSVSKKGAINLVTEADIASENLIIERIKSYFPRHAILAEESGKNNLASEFLWIIDPLDGTTNYAHGYPCFCVTIALEHLGEVILGVTYDPTRNELFTAERGAGAALNGKPIKVSTTNKLEDALLVTGFPYDLKQRPHLTQQFEDLLFASRGVRRDGSAAIDMAYVACGRFDGFWEEGLNPWDMAAGKLLIEEAGGWVTDYFGQPFDLRKPPVCASNGFIHNEMLKILQR
jgi:myo-inositol-1(or 4)-monophosphatase